MGGRCSGCSTDGPHSKFTAVCGASGPPEQVFAFRVKFARADRGNGESFHAPTVAREGNTLSLPQQLRVLTAGRCGSRVTTTEQKERHFPETA